METTDRLLPEEIQHRKEMEKGKEVKTKLDFRPIIKIVITMFYLLASIWVSHLIFSYMFESGQFTVDNSKVENVTLILIYSVGLSALGVFLLGILSLFTFYVYIKIIFGDEVKNAAMSLLDRKRFLNKKEITKKIVEPETEQING